MKRTRILTNFDIDSSVNESIFTILKGYRLSMVLIIFTKNESNLPIGTQRYGSGGMEDRTNDAKTISLQIVGTIILGMPN